MSNYSREMLPWPPGRHLPPDPGHSKCNAETDKKHITPSASKDNVSTFLIFLSPAYISLHERPARAAKFVKNRRSPRQPGKDGPKLVQNLIVLDQNIAAFGWCKGGSQTFHPNRSKYNIYENRGPRRPFISFHSFHRDGATPWERRHPCLLAAHIPRFGLHEAQMRQCITKNAIKPKQLNDIRTHFLGNVSNCLKMSHPSTLDPSLFKKTKAWKLGRAGKNRRCLILGIHRSNIKPGSIRTGWNARGNQ